MSKKKITVGLIMVIVLQVAVLAWEVIGAVLPLWTGTEIHIKTVPVDPRSLFRGNYARLRFDITDIAKSEFGKDARLRNGEIVYVNVKPGANGLYVFDSASTKKPDSGVFIRGRVLDWRSGRNSKTVSIRYGIEAYFASKKKALSLEKELGNGGVAVVMIAGNGKAALKAVNGERRDAG